MKDLQQRGSYKVKALNAHELTCCMMDTPKKPESRIGRVYDGLRSLTTPNQLTRRKTGAGIAVVADLLSLIRLSEDGEKFEKIRLCILQDNEYAQSIYRAATSRATPVVSQT